jgi:hypothetical protein
VATAIFLGSSARKPAASNKQNACSDNHRVISSSLELTSSRRRSAFAVQPGLLTTQRIESDGGISASRCSLACAWEERWWISNPFSLLLHYQHRWISGANRGEDVGRILVTGSQKFPHPILSSGLLEARAVPRRRSGVGKKLIPGNLKLPCDYLNRHSACLKLRAFSRLNLGI